MLPALFLTLFIADPVPTVDQAVAGVAAAQKEKAVAAAKEEAARKVLADVLAALNAKLKEIGVGPVVPEPIDPPRPVDPFVATLRAAYAAERVPADPAKKAEALKDLVEVYRKASEYARKAPEPNVRAVIDKVKGIAFDEGLTADAIVSVRKLIAAELIAAFPADIPLDAAGRDKLAAAFGRIHSALSQVSP